MKRSMKKTVFALCTALMIFMCNSTSAFAAICDGAPDGVHHFNFCFREKSVKISSEKHRYVYGYDVNNWPLYNYDCTVTYYHQYCIYLCQYCGTKQEGSQHTHLISTVHSVNHP